MQSLIDQQPATTRFIPPTLSQDFDHWPDPWETRELQVELPPALTVQPTTVKRYPSVQWLASPDRALIHKLVAVISRL